MSKIEMIAAHAPKLPAWAREISAALQRAGLTVEEIYRIYGDPVSWQRRGELYSSQHTRMMLPTVCLIKSGRFDLRLPPRVGKRWTPRDQPTAAAMGSPPPQVKPPSYEEQLRDIYQVAWGKR